MKVSRQGFTLVEIIIGLGVTGLIGVVVMLGIANLQKSRLDSARKANVNNLVSAIQAYISSGTGPGGYNKFPTCCTAPYPENWTWTSPITGITSGTPVLNQIQWGSGAPGAAPACQKPVTPDAHAAGWVATPLQSGDYYCVIYS